MVFSNEDKVVMYEMKGYNAKTHRLLNLGLMREWVQDICHDTGHLKQRQKVKRVTKHHRSC